MSISSSAEVISANSSAKFNTCLAALELSIANKILFKIYTFPHSFQENIDGVDVFFIFFGYEISIQNGYPEIFLEIDLGVIAFVGQ